MTPAVPVVVGVADFKNGSSRVEDAIEPMQLMLRALSLAIKDTALSDAAAEKLKSSIDSIDVVANWTWPYPDAPGLLAQKLNVQPTHKEESHHGGDSPARMFDEAARRISKRATKVAIVIGGEALASAAACAAAKKLPPPGWTKLEGPKEDVFAKMVRERAKIAGPHAVGIPTQIYPLYENGFRAHRKQTLSENAEESAKMYANFAQVASRNPNAWFHGKPAETEQSIRTVTKKNRMISYPYPLLMNAFNTINLAGACVLTTTEYATELGIPESKWIYALGGAGTADDKDFWKRQNFHSSPAITNSLDAALASSGLSKEQIDLYDFYSCFPIVPKFACAHLGLPLDGSSETPTTLLGGLTSFGGAGNNYSMHAITEMTRRLRGGKDTHGLILANGGVLTYQHAICLSSQPRKDRLPYPQERPLPEYTDAPHPVMNDIAEGAATIETYTVDFGRDGRPQLGHVVGILAANGHRFISNHADEATLLQLASSDREQVGRKGWVAKDSTKAGRNLFSFEKMARL